MSVDVAMVNGDFPLRSAYITGQDLTIQRIEVRLRMFLREGILDDTLGLPYVEMLSESKVDRTGFGAQVRRLILTTPGVVALRSFVVNHASRKLTVTGVIILGDKSAVAFSLEPTGPAGRYNHPYIVLNREV